MKSLFMLNYSPLGRHFVMIFGSSNSAVSSFFHQSPFFQCFIHLPGIVSSSDIAVFVVLSGL